MKIVIQGVDYTSAFDAVRPLTIERTLNEPSVCHLWLSLPAQGSLAVPNRYQTIAVSGDDGVSYFTGFIAVSPLPEYAGYALEGPRYRYPIHAVSEDVLLDQAMLAVGSGSAGMTAGALMAALVNRTGSRILSTSGLTLTSPISHFASQPGATWSSAARQVAAETRAAYRALSGTLALSLVATSVHRLDETDGSLNLEDLHFTASTHRALANDVTVCGEHEPTAYITEYFQGDGVRSQFYLADEPFFGSGAKQTILQELFNESSIDSRVWATLGGNSFLTLGSGGLAMNGGTGVDGQTLLEWRDPIEMGGSLLLEAAGVSLALGSSGILAGFFSGLEKMAGCVAGFNVSSQQGIGEVTLQPILAGNIVGLSYPMDAANLYTLRIRLAASEVYRIQSLYHSYGDDGAIDTGGFWQLASAKVVMEVQPFVNSVAGMPVVLYDGSLSNLPGTCMVVPASSVNLMGSMRSVMLKNNGSGWVVSTPPSGSTYTRRMGGNSEAAECYLDGEGVLTFLSGFIPANGERIAVSYRTKGRAVGRAVNAASQAALAAAGNPSVAVWMGSVSNPSARTSADCRNAATAIEQAAASLSALWSGTYRGNQLSFPVDVWPGDALRLVAPSTSLDAQVVVRSVKLSYSASYPDLVEYSIVFANDWANDLAIKTSSSVPDDAWLPASIAPTFLENLPGLAVTSVDGTSVHVTAGVTPPSGGGFEVRRRDSAFMAGQDTTLVLRSSVPDFTFARESANDRFYIRMYDGATPPNYSEFSAALFINLPVG